MNTLKYEGGTKAAWQAMLATAGSDPQKIRKAKDALSWFDEQEQAVVVARDERRFQAQLDETKRHGCWTRLFAGFAVLLSAGSLVVAILALNKPPQKIVIQTPAPLSVPVASLPQMTNSAPATPAQKKP
jgi:hypothetical protein